MMRVEHWLLNIPAGIGFSIFNTQLYSLRVLLAPLREIRESLLAHPLFN